MVHVNCIQYDKERISNVANPCCICTESFQCVICYNVNWNSVYHVLYVPKTCKLEHCMSTETEFSMCYILWCKLKQQRVNHVLYVPKTCKLEHCMSTETEFSMCYILWCKLKQQRVNHVLYVPKTCKLDPCMSTETEFSMCYTSTTTSKAWPSIYSIHLPLQSRLKAFGGSVYTTI